MGTRGKGWPIETQYRFNLKVAVGLYGSGSGPGALMISDAPDAKKHLDRITRSDHPKISIPEPDIQIRSPDQMKKKVK